MKSIRRLYFYLVAAISIEIVVWGLISLLRSIVDQTISGGADALAQALALILVGVPIFLIHWLWAQKASALDEDEKEAPLRALFLYGMLLGTLIPVVQNILSFINRAFVQSTGLGVERAFSAFREQTLADNLIAIVMNLIVATYFWNILRGEWATLADKKNFSDVRRLYRYIWMLYGLLMTLFGAQQILRFLIYIPGDTLGKMGREVIINGISLLVIGTPLWVYSWRVIQDSLPDPAEMGSALRLGILYLLALSGVLTVITTSALLVDMLVTRLFGANWTTQYFVQQIGGPVSVGVPLGVIWAYYGYWLNRHIEATGDKVRQAGMKRLYNYILAFIGLVVSFIGVTTLLRFIVNTVTSRHFLLGDATRSTIAAAISLLVVGLPLWLSTWRPMQADALATGEMGDHARRSVLRKTYLYLALFASVIGGMSTAAALIYQLLRVLLTGYTGNNFANTLLNIIQLLALFAVMLVYHLRVLQADGASMAGVLAEKQSAFPVLLVDSEEGIVGSVKAALTKMGSKVQVTVTPPAQKPEGEFKAVILSGSLTVNLPEWIRTFDGNRIIIQNEAPNLVWADDGAQAAHSVQMLAEGQEVRTQKPGRSPWMVVVYIFAALFGFFLLLMLFGLAMSVIVG